MGLIACRLEPCCRRSPAAIQNSKRLVASTWSGRQSSVVSTNELRGTCKLETPDYFAFANNEVRAARALLPDRRRDRRSTKEVRPYDPPVVSR